MMRTIRTGRTISRTTLSPVQIAELRPTEDPQLFLDEYSKYRGVVWRLWAASAGPLEVETLYRIARDKGPVQEAAMIEALAGLRAEGVQL